MYQSCSQNELAIQTKADEVQADVDGLPWRQRPFSYQAKCLIWLREAAQQLTGPERGQFMELIDGTGVERLFV